MPFFYNNGINGNRELRLTIGQKWSDLESKCKNKAALSIFEHVDKSDGVGDGIIQKEEVYLLRKLFSFAYNFFENSSKRQNSEYQTIDNDKMNFLKEQLENKNIDITKLREEVEKEKDIGFKYPNSEDITDNFDLKPASKYKAQIFKTNTAQIYTKTGENIEYNTYLLKFKDLNSNYEQEIQIHIDPTIKESGVTKIIQSIINQCDNNVIDMMCNELEDLFVASQKNNKLKFGGKKNRYGNLGHSTKASAFYDGKNEVMLMYNSGKPVSLNTFVHELGHAKDDYTYNTSHLFKLIGNHKSNTNDGYWLTSQAEMYAEFFRDYSAVRNHVKQECEKKYSAILEKIPVESREKFISEASISLLTGESVAIQSILERADIAEYKELFGENQELNIKLPKGEDNFDMKSRLSAIRKFGKKNPEISKVFNQFIREISNAYNHPRDAKQTIEV